MSSQQTNRIVLKGHVYATPRTESVEIVSQGVLCSSAVALNASSINSFTQGSGL